MVLTFENFCQDVQAPATAKEDRGRPGRGRARTGKVDVRSAVRKEVCLYLSVWMEEEVVVVVGDGGTWHGAGCTHPI